jgi:hypothetical protein
VKIGGNAGIPARPRPDTAGQTDLIIVNSILNRVRAFTACD